MNLEKNIRKLARSTYWQNIFHASKDLSSISLFSNTSNFSGIQAQFLYWLRVYYSIYENLSEMEFDFLDEKMIEDDLRVDAFLFWRGKYYDAERRKYKEEEKARKINNNPKQGKKSYCNVDLRSE